MRGLSGQPVDLEAYGTGDFARSRQVAEHHFSGKSDRTSWDVDFHWQLRLSVEAHPTSCPTWVRFDKAEGCRFGVLLDTDISHMTVLARQV
jgi:hypothetical protein